MQQQGVINLFSTLMGLRYWLGLTQTLRAANAEQAKSSETNKRRGIPAPLSISIIPSTSRSRLTPECRWQENSVPKPELAPGFGTIG
jgi:hypothetical protein